MNEMTNEYTIEVLKESDFSFAGGWVARKVIRGSNYRSIVT